MVEDSEAQCGRCTLGFEPLPTVPGRVMSSDSRERILYLLDEIIFLVTKDLHTSPG